MTETPNNAKPWLRAGEVPFIRLSNVTKDFGAVRAVDHVSLDIFKGELFCLVGGSGCGKSTLLRMLAGFEHPTEGKIEIDGQDMAGIPAHGRPTNMMFQSYALFPHMSVEKNVAYGLLREGVSKVEAKKRTAEMLDLVQLSELSRRKPNQLSGGQQQRVALARSLVKKPKLLLLDEPLGALDKKLREETQFELVNIQESLGVTFIVVTHDQEEAMTLSTRIGVMRDGRIEQVGEPRDIYEAPSNRFVADFIGSVNLFEGIVKETNAGSITLASDEIGGELNIVDDTASAKGDQVSIAIRPEKLEISHDKPIQKHNIVGGVVEDIAYLGNQSIYLIRLKTGKLVRLTRSNRLRSEERPIDWEDEVWLSWEATAGVVLTT